MRYFTTNCSIITNDIDGAFGFEDYKLVAAVPESFLKKLDKYIVIGKVEEYNGTVLKIGNKEFNKHEELKLYDHFGEKDE